MSASPSPWQRLNSWRHGFAYFVSENVRHSRGMRVEAAAGDLVDLTAAEAARVAELRARYGVRFETGMSARTSLGNYEYLDILDRGWAQTGRDRPEGGTVIDVGCASFWYAAALQAFYRPSRLIGVELEGYRRLQDGHSRIDHARGYLRGMPNAEFRVADFVGSTQSADVISAWFPFLTPGAILAWRLPLKFLQTERFFDTVHRSLTQNSIFVMANHGPAEAALAAQACAIRGLQQVVALAEVGPFSALRRQPPLLSAWRRTGQIAGPHCKTMFCQ